MPYLSVTLTFLFGFVPWMQLYGQDLMYPYWNMQELTPLYTPIPTCTITNLVPGNNYGNTVFLSEASASVGYTGASGNMNASLASRTGPLQTEAMGSAYLEFSIVPVSGYRFIVKAISFGVRSTQTGPQQWGLFQQEDQYSTSLAQGVIENNSIWSWVSIEGLTYSAGKAIRFRIYGFGGTGNPAINVANWRLDDLKIHLQVVPENLPVKWLYQRIHSSHASVVVEWGTEEELKADSFLVQRSSDAIHFENIAMIPSQSRLEQVPRQRFYQYEDPLPLPGRSFYRILQKDIDGTLEFGKVLSHEQIEVRHYVVKPQVVFCSSTGEIKLYGIQNGPIAIQLYSMWGQLIVNYNSRVVEGILHLPHEHLAKGYYIMVLRPFKVDGHANRISSILYIN